MATELRRMVVGIVEAFRDGNWKGRFPAIVATGTTAYPSI